VALTELYEYTNNIAILSSHSNMAAMRNTEVLETVLIFSVGCLKIGLLLSRQPNSVSSVEKWIQYR
jgi:hypothetical protein